jgi:hypothetical protein
MSSRGMPPECRATQCEYPNASLDDNQAEHAFEDLKKFRKKIFAPQGTPLKNCAQVLCNSLTARSLGRGAQFLTADSSLT